MNLYFRKTKRTKSHFVVVVYLALSVIKVKFLFSDQCRTLTFTPAHTFNGKRLVNHVIRLVYVTKQGSCRARCYWEPNCVSYNFRILAGENGEHKCELNNSTHEGHENEMKENSNYAYRGAEVRNVPSLKLFR